MTNIVPSLSALALRHLIEGVSHALGFFVAQEGLESAIGFLTGHFRDHSKRLTLALNAANERAWRALELSLAGESWWERVRRVLASTEQRAFSAQVRIFLEATPLAGHGAEFRRQCLQDLRRARKTGHLTRGSLDPEALARQAGAFARYADPKALLDAEWQAVEQMADELRGADFVALSRLLAARPADGAAREAPPLLVVAVRYFFRRAVETDRELFQGLAFARMEGVSQAQEAGFSALGEALTHHGQRLEELLDELSETVTQTHEAVLDMQAEQQRQGEHVQEIYQGVRNLLEQHLLLRRDLHAHDSLSIRNDGERQLVKSLVSRYRALPPEQRQKLPALLNGLAKLEVVAGEFDAAQGDFREVAALVASDPEARAEAHHNAYRAALERRDWGAALDELLQAVALDAPRFAPFPVDKYQPQRILGAGGFGVAFLCRHRNSGIPLVVKALVADDLDRDIGQVFAEARILEELEHPAIIRLRDCDFVDPARRARPYLVMDYFEGATLEDYIREHGSLSAADWLALARPVADGLQAAHAKGILHRDVKPANLLVRREPGAPGDVGPRWRVKLIDFGLALRREARHSTVNTGKRDRTILGASIAGTLDYAAPEQMGRLPGIAVGPYSDLYGFGKTCCYALFKTAQPAYQHWRKLPEPVAELIGHCIAEAPAERPPTFAAILDQLEMREASPIVLEAIPATAAESASAASASTGREVVLASLNAKVMQMMRWLYLGLVLGGILGMVSSAIGRYHRSVATGEYWSANTEATGCLAGGAAVWSLLGGICLALAHYYKRTNATPPQAASLTAMCFLFLLGAILGGGAMGLGAAAMGYSTQSFVGTWLGVSFSAAVAGWLVGMAVTTDFERALRVGMLGSLLGALIVVMTYFINAPAAGAVVAGAFGAICAAAADIVQRQFHPGAMS